jgi:ATP-dependent RNA helicase RhlE
VPHSPEDYVHRIGRTGRAGLPGEAISLVAPQDMEAMAAIERLIKKRIERALVPGFAPSGATVAALIGGQAGRKDRRPAAAQPNGAADPIFSKPYEPAAPSEPQKAAESERKGKRRQPQVAALLGGLKRG